MADIDEMYARGVPFRALVDGQGVAMVGTLTMEELSRAGMMPACEVDASGIANDGSTILELRARGIPFFCEVTEFGVDPVTGDTNRMLANRGIRGDCMLTENGIAQGGVSTMVELSRRGIDYFCPVDEAGNETTVGGVDVTPPVFTTPTTGTNPENTVLAFTITTNEQTTKAISGGLDATKYEIVNGGVSAFSHTLRWLANGTKNFEVPDDSNTNGIYTVTVTATDAALNATGQMIMITVTDVDEVAPTITSANTANNVEGNVLAHALTASEAVTWTNTGGADTARFEISGSTLRWLGNGVKDFDAPDDVGTNNTYVVQVTATDAALNATNQTITVTVDSAVAGVPDPPALTWTSAGTNPNPTFDIVLDTPVENDTVQFQVADEITFTPADVEVDDVLDAGEISAEAITPAIGELADGVWYVRARHKHSGDTYSEWSNIETLTINTYLGLGDVQGGALGYWGLRGYSAADVGSNCVTLRRASDNATQTFAIQYGGFLDHTAIVAFRDGAGASTVFITTLFDQVGSCDLTQATTTKQPELVLTVLTNRAVMRFVRASGQHLQKASGSGITSTSPYTQLVVFNRTGNVTAFQGLFGLTSSAGTPPVSRLASNSTANTVTSFNGTGPGFVSTASDNAWHCYQGMFITGSSASRNKIDAAADATGTTSANTLVSGAVQLGCLTDGVEHLDGMLTEAVVWSGDGGATVRSNLSANALNAWII